MSEYRPYRGVGPRQQREAPARKWLSPSWRFALLCKYCGPFGNHDDFFLCRCSAFMRR
jgi:hypothetical protein